ncbi:MAG: type II toxin-antitoxin system VapB family antitoxin [Gammaproteobacteria bacterium]|nr:MAG: type II toxin-antitoxin system VapB family antitoxin [Gammaproteobacteria bacterium]
MRTNIVLDDTLIDEAMRLSRARTKREVVNLALKELVQRHQQRNLKQLKGKGLIDPEYDVPQVRRNMNRDAD